VPTGNYDAGVNEAARHIGRSAWQVRYLARNGLIPYRRLTPTGRLEFDLAELDRWMDAGRKPVKSAS
jgi:DNA-binding transcriptional MerR regulator